MTAGRAVQGTAQWLSGESALDDEAWEGGCRMVALRRKDLIALGQWHPIIVTATMCQEETRESTKSSPALKG